MWEQFMNCFKRSSKVKRCNLVKMSELYKRVPPNQRKQLHAFVKKNEMYKERVRKYPASMPSIDWNYYEQNVRPDYVKWVKNFKLKYDKLDSLFENRHALIDHSPYFAEVSKETEELKEQIKKFKAESNERIKLLQKEWDRLKNLRPYEEMTMEEFCEAHPDSAPDFINRPTFWPHTPEEQQPGPSEVHMSDEKPPIKPTSTGSGATKPTSPSPSVYNDSKPDGQKRPDGTDGKDKLAGPSSSDNATTFNKSPISKPPTADSDGDVKAKACFKLQGLESHDHKVKKEAKSSQDHKSDTFEQFQAQVEQVAAELMAKGSALTAALAAKSSVLLKELLEKVFVKMKEVDKAAQAVRNEKSMELVRQEAKPKQKQTKPEQCAAKPKLDAQPLRDGHSFHVREGSSNICMKTIIRGEEQDNADVKPHHVNLDIEQEAESECKEYNNQNKKETDDDEDNICEEYNRKWETKKGKCQRDETIAEWEEEKVDNGKKGRFGSGKEKPKYQDTKCDIMYGRTNKEQKGVATKPLGDTKEPKAMFSSYEAGSETIKGLVPEHYSKLFTTEEGLKNSQKSYARSDETSKMTGKITCDLDDHQMHNELKKEDKFATEVLEVQSTKETKDLTLKQKNGRNDTLNNEADTYNSKSNLMEKEMPDYDEIPTVTSEKNSKAIESKGYSDDSRNKASDQIFNMATLAATILSSATKIVREVQKDKSSKIEKLEKAYNAAQKQADRAIAEANRAVNAAKKFKKRAQCQDGENNAFALVEKHVYLAKLLAKRALHLKKQINELLEALKKTEDK